MLIAFVLTPLIEIAVLIQVGGWIGLWPTLGLIILTAIAGTWMLRQQGFAVMARAQQQLEEGSLPLGEVFEGFCLVIAGALLLTPGFVTDIVGGSLLLPPVRAWLYKTLGSRFREAAMPKGHRQGTGAPAGQGPTRGSGPVVDGEFETVQPDAQPEEPERSPDEVIDDNGVMPPPRGRWDGKP